MCQRTFTLGLALFAACIFTACSGESEQATDETPSTPPIQAAPSTTSNEAAPTPPPVHSSPTNIDTSVGDPPDMGALGAAAWQQGKCTMCHGADGRGNRFGPNLTDGQWDHCDGSVEGIRQILVTGIPKDQFVNPSYMMAMPAATVLISDETKLDALAAYVEKLSSNPSETE